MAQPNRTKISRTARESPFEVFLAELTAGFVSLEPEDVDGAITEGLRRICEVLDLDVAVVWQWCDTNESVLALTHYYRRYDGPPVPPDIDARESFPWTLDEILAGRTVRFARLDDAPAEAAVDLGMWRHFELGSVLVMPLTSGGGPINGIISFHTVHDARQWPDTTVQRLQLVAQVFTNALARKQTDAALRTSEARLQLAAESADIGMWALDIEGLRFWATERARAIFEYGSDAEITMERFLESVCPEHRQAVAEALRRGVEEGRDIDVEYRISLPDGGARWVHSRGRLLPASGNRPPRLQGASVDVTGRKDLESELMDRLQFETLLTGIVARFVDAAGDRVDREIEQALCEVGTFFRADRCGLLEVDRELQRADLRFVWYGDGVPRVSQEVNLAEHFPWTFERLVNGRRVVEFASLEELPSEAGEDRRSWVEQRVKSCLIVPLAIGDAVRHLLVVQCLSHECSWPEDVVTRLSLLGAVFENALERRRAEDELQRSFEEIGRLQRQLELENAYLREEHRLHQGQGRIVGESPAIMKVLRLVEQVAPTGSTVLIDGETGTGKELVAQRVHELSQRHGRPMVKVNCAALPSTLVESELFGREKGAYTGAVSREPGRFEVADGSTLFLDEIAELPFELQAKLLRVLEEGRFERVGSSRTLTTDARVIAATNRDLEAEVEAGRFRRDLYFRLAVFPITVPPLRERPGDIPLLVWAMVHELSGAMNRSVEAIHRDDMDRLQRYEWPGNVRELRNLVERALILSSGPTLRIELPTAAGQRPSDEQVVLSLDEAQKRHIVAALECASGRIRGPGGAAELLDVKPTTLRSRMQRLGIDPRQHRSTTSAG